MEIMDFPRLGISEARSRSICKNPAFENKIPRENLDCVSFVLKEFVLSDILLLRNAWIVDSCLQSLLPFCLPSGSDGEVLDIKPLID